MRLFDDISNPIILYIKGLLFLIAGILSSAIILLENPRLKTISLLIISVWSFCRFYYFLFYVIEKYTVGKFKFSGVISAIRYFAGK